jgi:hypothetical protein
MRAFLPRLPLLVLPVLLFLALFHPAILDPTNAGWLIRGSDNGENALGLHAWLHDPAPGLLRTRLLNAPDGVPLLFTDSNPLLALLLKPFASLLPADFQAVGLWYLLCLFLQVFFAWRLLRDRAPGPVALWCGVTLLAMLPTLANRYLHANLFAHWLILWALDRFLDPAKAGSNRGWAPLIALTALIHSYLLVMVGAIYASAMLERFVALRGDSRRRAILVAGAAAMLAMVVAIAWLLGALEPHVAAGNYGAFAMPLDALFNPGNPSYSRLLPSIEQRPGRGFEGFQYLGAGLLVLVPIAALTAWRTPAPADARATLRRLRWLVPALLALTLLAVSNYPDFAGHALPRIRLPGAVSDALDPIRASGRLFWPAAYVIALVLIVTAFRHRQAGALLAAVLAIQLVDLSGLFAAVRAESAEADRHHLYVRTTDPRWDALILTARDIGFVPPDARREFGLFQEIAWRAATLRRPVRIVYAARDSRATLSRWRAEQAQFDHGSMIPGRLYVLGRGVAAPAGVRVIALDGVRMVLQPE